MSMQGENQGNIAGVLMLLVVLALSCATYATQQVNTHYNLYSPLHLLPAVDISASLSWLWSIPSPTYLTVALNGLITHLSKDIPT
jgi:hypothetical protein